MDKQSEKPILVSRFTKIPAEWAGAEYFNVRTGKPCRITTGHTKRKNVVPVRSYRDVLNSYVNNPETKFNGPDGLRCGFGTRGILQRKQVVAKEHCYCGKEQKRKLEQGPVDHEINAKCRVYENGRVAASEDLLKRIANLSLSERAIAEGSNLHRKPVHLFCSGKYVRPKTAQQIIDFVERIERAGMPECVRALKRHSPA